MTNFVVRTDAICKVLVLIAAETLQCDLRSNNLFKELCSTETESSFKNLGKQGNSRLWTSPLVELPSCILVPKRSQVSREISQVAKKWLKMKSIVRF